MEATSLKIPKDLLDSSDRCAEAWQISRAEYKRRAVDRMNHETRDVVRARRMTEASRRVREESMRVSADFAVIEGEPDV